MDIRFQNLGPEKWKADALLAPVTEDCDILHDNPELDKVAPWLAIAPARRDFTAKKGESAVLYGHPALAVPRVFLIGLGRREDFTLDTLRRAIADAVQRCRALGLKSILLPEPVVARLPGSAERLLEECVFAAETALYTGALFKKKDAGAPADPECFAVGFNEQTDAGQQAARRGESAAEALRLARELANTPANLLAPADMADRAQAIAAGSGFACTVLTEEDLKSEGMGAHLAVGQGSAHPPRLVVLEYAPEGHADDAPIVLVGKGITFDSGGISLKPAAKMHQMKSDMTGAAAVLAAVAAAAREALPRRVIGLLAMAENLPGGSAARPGDVVRGFNGDTIEITNTDAEGRLVLCDALAYAQKRWQPEAVVDIATLTGACAVALGNDLAGLFSTDDVLAERISASGKACGEYFWRLPLWAPYAEKLKSGIADICHTGPREGGAINAALFLKHFVADGVRWAHLDIAGTDWMEVKNPLCPAGATAFGARTLLELLRGGVR